MDGICPIKHRRLRAVADYGTAFRWLCVQEGCDYWTDSFKKPGEHLGMEVEIKPVGEAACQTKP